MRRIAEMNETELKRQDFRLLHPATPFLRVFAYARQIIVAIIFFIFFSRNDAWEWVAAAVAIPLGAYEIARYFTTTYALDAQQLIVRSGILFRSERHIPYERIQNIDLVQKLIHRFLSVGVVSIETASGSEPEAVFNVLSLKNVEILREKVLLKESMIAEIVDQEEALSFANSEVDPVVAATPVDDGIELLRISLTDLVLLGLFTYRGLAVIGIGLGIIYQFDLSDTLEREFESLSDTLPNTGILLYLLLVALAIGTFLLLTLLSICWSVMTFFDYRLTRVGEDLRITCGLFTKLTATVPRSRIQLVSVQQSLMHRLFSRWTIRVETAGGSGDEDEVPIHRRWLVPVVKQEHVSRILAEIAPGFPTADNDWQTVHPRAAKRLQKKAVVVSIFAAIACTFLLEFLAFVAIPVIFIALLWLAKKSAAAYRYQMCEEGLTFASGVLTRRQSTTRFDRIQIVRWEQSPFDKRYGMARFIADTAGACPAEHKLNIPYLDAEIASQLRETAETRVNQTEFRWR